MYSPSDAAYGRLMLAEITPDVRKHVPGVRLRDAWVWCAGRDHWEFHYQDFYWHGSAGSAYEARYKGWDAYLAHLGVEGYKREEVWQ
jgi:hypothetical protein